MTSGSSFKAGKSSSCSRYVCRHYSIISTSPDCLFQPKNDDVGKVRRWGCLVFRQAHSREGSIYSRLAFVCHGLAAMQRSAAHCSRSTRLQCEE